MSSPFPYQYLGAKEFFCLRLPFLLLLLLLPWPFFRWRTAARAGWREKKENLLHPHHTNLSGSVAGARPSKIPASSSSSSSSLCHPGTIGSEGQKSLEAGRLSCCFSSLILISSPQCVVDGNVSHGQMLILVLLDETGYFILQFDDTVLIPVPILLHTVCILLLALLRRI